MDSPSPLVCAGRPVDDHGLQVGKACRRRFHGPEYVGDGQGHPRLATAADRDERARAAGWSVAGPPMCPACRKPDPAISRGLITTKEK